jgi:DinB family protein
VSRSSLTIEQVLTLLAETPRRLDALTEGLNPALLRTSPGQDVWSANDILAHLRACADVWGGCIATIMAEDRPTLRGMDPRHWMKQTDYLKLEFRPSLRAFATQRAELLAVLEPLPPEGWARTATVMAWGTPFERTVLSYGQRLAIHERPHVKQVARIVDAMRE